MGQLYMDFYLLQAARAICIWIFVRCKLHGPIVQEHLFAASCMGKLLRGLWLLQAAGDWFIPFT